MSLENLQEHGAEFLAGYNCYKDNKDKVLGNDSNIDNIEIKGFNKVIYNIIKVCAIFVSSFIVIFGIVMSVYIVLWSF